MPIKATNSSQKEIVAGEERPKYLTVKQGADNNQGTYGGLFDMSFMFFGFWPTLRFSLGNLMGFVL